MEAENIDKTDSIEPSLFHQQTGYGNVTKPILMGKPLHVKHPPPPRRRAPLTMLEYELRREEEFKNRTRGERFKDSATEKGLRGLERAVKVSDWAGTKVNGWAEYYFGLERFMPVSGDMRLEMEKCARILHLFTVDGIPKPANESSSKFNKKFVVHRKIPAEIIQNCAGLIIYSTMRMGQLVSGGSGGSGVIIAHLGEGQWSAPSAILPNDMSLGFVLGLDFLDAVIVIKTQKAMESFLTHNVTLGSEVDCAAGPWGGLGASAEVSWKGGPPVLTYARSRGYYAGIDLKGQFFMERFDENERQYYWPGVRARDILAGKVDFPIEGMDLKKALFEAEFAERTPEIPHELDVDPGEDMGEASLREISSLAAELKLEKGEVLKLPPTPLQKLTSENKGDDEDDPSIISIRPPSKTFATTQPPGGPPVPERRRPVSTRSSLVSHAKQSPKIETQPIFEPEGSLNSADKMQSKEKKKSSDDNKSSGVTTSSTEKKHSETKKPPLENAKSNEMDDLAKKASDNTSRSNVSDIKESKKTESTISSTSDKMNTEKDLVNSPTELLDSSEVPEKSPATAPMRRPKSLQRKKSSLRTSDNEDSSTKLSRRASVNDVPVSRPPRSAKRANSTIKNPSKSSGDTVDDTLSVTSDSKPAPEKHVQSSESSS